MEHNGDPGEVWQKQKHELLKKFSQLTENDFKFDYGMKDVMMEKLKVKLGMSREELNSLLLSL